MCARRNWPIAPRTARSRNSTTSPVMLLTLCWVIPVCVCVCVLRVCVCVCVCLRTRATHSTQHTTHSTQHRAHTHTHTHTHTQHLWGMQATKQFWCWLPWVRQIPSERYLQEAMRWATVGSVLPSDLAAVLTIQWLNCVFSTLTLKSLRRLPSH